MIIAMPGDTVEHRDTGQVMEVIGQTNSGRIIVDSGAKWERYSAKVLARPGVDLTDLQERNNNGPQG